MRVHMHACVQAWCMGTAVPMHDARAHVDGHVIRFEGSDTSIAYGSQRLR